MAEYPNMGALNAALDIYRDEMRPFVHSCMRRIPGMRAADAIAEVLNDRARENFRDRIERGESVEGAIDAGNIPHIVRRWWRDVFSREFAYDRVALDLMGMIHAARNKWAHPGEHDLDAPYVRARVHDIADVMRRIGRDEAARRVDAILERLDAPAAPPPAAETPAADPAAEAPAAAPPPAEAPPRPAGTGMTGDAAVVEFRDDEDGYLDWVRRNRGGWVINAGRNLTRAGRLVLHRATCRSIATRPPHTKDYIKFCSTDRSALLARALGVEWVRSAADISTGCPFCSP